MEFKPVKGYEDRYLISDSGHVKSIKKLVKVKNHFRVTGGKILKPLNHDCGYLMVNLYKDRNTVRIHFIHRLVMEAFCPIEIKLDVNHKNGIKTDNRLENLEWATRVENIRHSIDNGFTKPQKSGIDSFRSKLVTDGSEVYNYSQASKISGYCLSYFSAMMKGRHFNKTKFSPVNL